MAKKVLQVCHKPPFPEIDGGCLEMAKMSRFFDSDNRFELDILCIHTNKHPFSKENFEKNLENSSFNSLYINTRLNPFVALSKLIKNQSYHLSRFKTVKFSQELIEILKKKNYDYIFFESIFVAQYANIVRTNSTAKLILNSPNIEFEIWERLKDETSNPLKKKYLQILSRQLKKEENEICNKMDAIIAITEKDLEYYSQIFPNTKSTSIPFLLDLNKYKLNNRPMNGHIRFYHLGAMNWQPNIEGLKWFISEVWNKKFNHSKKIKLTIAGKEMPQFFFDLTKTNLDIHGWIEDAKKFIAEQDVMIVPLRSGSGLRIKILEAMAHGKCVISTSIGAEGINYTENVNLLIANTEQDFENQINFVSQNPKKIIEIGKNARKLIEEQYNQLLLTKIIPNFLELIDE